MEGEGTRDAPQDARPLPSLFVASSDAKDFGFGKTDLQTGRNVKAIQDPRETPQIQFSQFE